MRGRGLLARSIIQAQTASPMFTHVYAALVAIINTKFPQTGELIAKRILIRFRKSFRRNDKVYVCTSSRSCVANSYILQSVCIAAVKFLAHLVNQQVLHELVALELLTLLLDEPSDDSVEVAVGFIKVRGHIQYFVKFRLLCDVNAVFVLGVWYEVDLCYSQGYPRCV